MIINKFFNNKLFNVKYSYISIPKPYEFVNVTLESGLDLSSIISEVNTLLPQLASFVDQFHTLVTQSGVNVITDSVGNMSMDVPNGMSDLEVERVTKRIGIIDRLINTHGTTLNDLFQKGLSIEDKLKIDDPRYVSKLSDQIAQFKKLNASYKH